MTVEPIGGREHALEEQIVLSNTIACLQKPKRKEKGKEKAKGKVKAKESPVGNAPTHADAMDRL